MKKRYLVTGASGFIGSHLVELLLEKNVTPEMIRIIVPKKETLDNLPSVDFEVIRGDIRNKKLVKRAMKNVDFVYHLAAMTIKPGRTYKDYKTTNVDGTKNLLEESAKANIKKFIFFSSISVYGLPAYVGEVVNWNENRPKIPSEDYGKSKLEAEKLVISAHKEYGLPYCIIRPTTVYGPRDHQSLIELYSAINKGYFFQVGNGDNKVDYVFVKDLVEGAYKGQVSKRKTGDYIIGAGTPTKFKNIVELVSKSINKSIPKLSVPKNIALLVSYLTRYLNKSFGISIPLYPDRVRVMTTTCYFDISKAKSEIGYIPAVSMKEGTKLTGKWFTSKLTTH